MPFNNSDSAIIKKYDVQNFTNTISGSGLYLEPIIVLTIEKKTVAGTYLIQALISRGKKIKIYSDEIVLKLRFSDQTSSTFSAINEKCVGSCLIYLSGFLINN